MTRPWPRCFSTPTPCSGGSTATRGSRTGRRPRSSIRRETVLVSAASAWEITTKHRLGKLPGAADVARDVRGCILGQGFEELAITVADAERAGRLTGPHRDPFDRMLIAQASGRDLLLVSNEVLFDSYGITRLW